MNNWEKHEMTININELRKLVQAATPGPWVATTVVTAVGVCHKVGPFPGRTTEHPPRHACLYVDYESAGNPADREIYANAHLIAAANPAAISELLDRLEAAERKLDDVAQQLVQAEVGKRKLDAECGALRAKIKQMEQQEPVAEWVENKFHHYPQLIWDEKYKAVAGTKLYALPGAQAQPAPSFADAYQGAMEKQEPVAWLHETRRDSDVVTDAVKHVWGKAAVGSMAAYSIPLYALPGAKGEEK